jgi:hypothetical protein
VSKGFWPKQKPAREQGLLAQAEARA